LYNGFISKEDRRLLDNLRRESPARLAVASPSFSDGRLAELLFRYRARNFPTTLTEAEHARWLEHCAARLHDGAGGALTLARFFERVDALAEAADDAGDERQQALLEALYDYAESIAPERV
jgi:exodeoxyribonuclease-1